jgi:hypothetical protein
LVVRELLVALDCEEATVAILFFHLLLQLAVAAAAVVMAGAEMVDLAAVVKKQILHLGLVLLGRVTTEDSEQLEITQALAAAAVADLGESVEMQLLP